MTGAGKLLMSRSDGWPGTGSALGCRVSLSSTRLQVAQALDSPPCWWSSSRYEIWTPHLLSNFILVKSDPKEVSQSSRWTFQSVLLTRLGSANRADHISNGRVQLTRFHQHRVAPCLFNRGSIIWNVQRNKMTRSVILYSFLQAKCWVNNFGDRICGHNFCHRLTVSKN